MDYLDEGWQTLLERDTDVAVGIFGDACMAWSGDDDAMPNVLDALIKAEVALDNYETVIEACKEHLRLLIRIGMMK